MAPRARTSLGPITTNALRFNLKWGAKYHSVNNMSDMIDVVILPQSYTGV